MMIKKFGALLLSAVLCVGMAVPAFAYGGEPVEEVEQPVLTDSSEEDAVTVTDESSGALTPEGNLTLVDDYHTNYSDGSGQQFITLVSKSGKSSDMFGKCRYLDEITGGRGVIFATGTPISNSMTEMYTLMRYLQYNTLQQKGLTHFDAWASTFGETTTAIELAPEGYT